MSARLSISNFENSCESKETVIHGWKIKSQCILVRLVFILSLSFKVNLQTLKAYLLYQNNILPIARFHRFFSKMAQQALEISVIISK